MSSAVTWISTPLARPVAQPSSGTCDSLGLLGRASGPHVYTVERSAGQTDTASQLVHSSCRAIAQSIRLDTNIGGATCSSLLLVGGR